MAYYEYEAVEPHLAEQGLVSLRDEQWPDGTDDTILSIRAGGNGDLYVVGSEGDIFVKFDASQHDHVHAAARWVAKFIESIES